jgi:hypothetical protein
MTENNENKVTIYLPKDSPEYAEAKRVQEQDFISLSAAIRKIIREWRTFQVLRRG